MILHRKDAEKISDIFKEDFFTLETMAISLVYSQCPKEQFIKTGGHW